MRNALASYLSSLISPKPPPVSNAHLLELANGSVPELPEYLHEASTGFTPVSFNSTTLPDEMKDWIMSSIETSLKPYYASSTMTWSRREKLDDLEHPHQKFIIVKNGEVNVAFLSYRWDIEDGFPVMYVYELFVAESVRRMKIGQSLMLLAETLCQQNNIPKIVLTVFERNESAMRFYRQKLKYCIDDDSPSKWGHQTGYEILSKSVDVGNVAFVED